MSNKPVNQKHKHICICGFAWVVCRFVGPLT